MVRFLVLAIAATVGVLGGPGPFAVSAAVAGDPGRGRAVFKSQCSNCHSNSRGTVIVGPPLYGVIGRRAGSIPGFSYSATMKSAGFTWSPEKLRAYLPAPRRYLPNVKMTYPGLKNPNQLEDLIAYLQTLNDTTTASAGRKTKQGGRSRLYFEPFRRSRSLTGDRKGGRSWLAKVWRTAGTRPPHSQTQGASSS